MVYADIKNDDAWSAAPGRPADPGRVWLSLTSHWHWIPLAGAIWGALGLAVGFGLIASHYRSRATLIWAATSERPPDPRTMAAEIQSFKQPATIAKVRERLKLAVPLAALSRQVDLRFEPQRRLVVLSGDGASGRDAARLTRGVLDVFLEQQRENGRGRSKAELVGLRKEAADVRESLDEARKAYEALQAEGEITDASATAQSERNGTAGVATAAKARPSGARIVPVAVSTLETQKIEQLRSELAAARARSADDPRIPALEAQLMALSARVRRNSEQVPVETRVADPRLKKQAHSRLWRFLVPEQGGVNGGAERASVQLRSDREENVTDAEGAAVERAALQRDVAVQAENLANVDREIARVEAAIAAQPTDWRVLTAPTEPSQPDRTTQDLIATVMPLMGMLFALVALLVRPITDWRIYTAREAAYWSKLPVLGSSGWPRNREMLFPLVDELGHQAARAGGNTLLVGATGIEKMFAEELAYWLGGPVGNRGGTAGPVSARGETAASAVVGPEEHGFVGNPDGTVSVAPVLRPAETLAVFDPEASQKAHSGAPTYRKGVHLWPGELDGPPLRRAARLADRVIVLVSSGTMAFTELSGLRTRLGRNAGIGLVLLNVGPALFKLPDQAGEVGKFWRQPRH